MPKLKYFLQLTLLFLIPTSFPQPTQAQWVSPPIIDQCGYQEARCQRDRNGNIVDKKTGSVYDRKGNFLRRGNKINQKRCKYVTDDRCYSPYNVNCTERYYWKCK